MMEEYIILFWTAPNQKEGEQIASLLLKEKAAACISILPKILSLYTWKGKVEKEEEVKVLIKTKKTHFAKVRDIILENASYDVPEILALSITLGSKSYLEWIDSVC